MQQKKKRRLRVSDVLLVIVCLTICAASLWFFWKDLNSSSTRTDVDKIATIHFKRKVSQRKFSDRVVWERLQQDSELYNNDTIRTSEGAEAVIMFTDGTQIDLTENTMIQIVIADDGVLNLAVDGGTVEIDTTASKSEGVKLSMNDGSSVNLEKGSLVSASSSPSSGAGAGSGSKSSSGAGSSSNSNSSSSSSSSSGSGAASSITVRNGNAVVSTSTGKTQTVKSGEAVSI